MTVVQPELTPAVPTEVTVTVGGADLEQLRRSLNQSRLYILRRMAAGDVPAEAGHREIAHTFAIGRLFGMIEDAAWVEPSYEPVPRRNANRKAA